MGVGHTCGCQREASAYKPEVGVIIPIYRLGQEAEAFQTHSFLISLRRPTILPDCLMFQVCNALNFVPF